MKDQKSKEMNTKERIKEILMPEQPLHKLWDVCKCDECRVYREILTVFDEAISKTRTSFRELVNSLIYDKKERAKRYQKYAKEDKPDSKAYFVDCVRVDELIRIIDELKSILASLDGEEVKQNGQ